MPDLPASMLDVEQIKRVFVNLIDNALDALLHEENPKQITIVTRHDAERSLLIADVSDTGRGIEPGISSAYFSHTSRAETVALDWV
jgi:sensor histidine kinase regulating citrate/malate metabolism